MVSLGRSDLVRTKLPREKKPASTKKAQQELGCSVNSTDSNLVLHHHSHAKYKHVKSKDNESTTSEPLNLESNVKTESAQRPSTSVNSINKPESEELRSTGATQSEEIGSEKNKEQSKTIIGSLKNFFKFQLPSLSCLHFTFLCSSAKFFL